jgi:release factor glutamine methyltransferase
MTDLDYLKKYYNGNLDYALKRLKNGEPVQYIVGNVDFYNLNFIVNKSVLIPRFETEELVEKTIEYAKMLFMKQLDIIDLGTGSGCIAIALKNNLDANVDAVDISIDALTVAKENAKKNNIDVNFFQNDMLHNIEKKYDIIISNPPYISYKEEIMAIVKNNEPHQALYALNDGLYFYEDILKNAQNNLKDKYLVAFEIGSLQGDQIKKLAKKYFPNSIIVVEKDLTGVDRFFFMSNIDIFKNK